MMDAPVGLFALLYIVCAVAFMWWLWIVVPYKMARARNRDTTVWVLVSLCLTPLVAIPLLWLLEDAGPY